MTEREARKLKYEMLCGTPKLCGTPRAPSDGRGPERGLQKQGAVFQRLSTPRRGLTLIELLMVIFILVILVAATLPFVRPALQGRKIREAARQVNVFFATAQAMAAEKGRPFGVWIERSDLGDIDGDGLIDSNAGLELFYAETGPAYTGDLIGATGVTWDAAIHPDMVPPVDPMNATTDGIVDHFLLDSQSLFLLTLVRPGDMIQFDNKGPLYIIQDANGDGFAINDWRTPLTPMPPWVNQAMRPAWVSDPAITHSIEIRLAVNWQPGIDARWGVAGVDDDMDGTTDNLLERGWPGSDDFYTTDPPAPPNRTRLQYQIFRAPIKSGVSPMTLPVGTAIDLHHSGIGAIGQQFRADNTSNVASGVTAPILDNQPVIVMFNPTGDIASVYYGVIPRDGSGDALGASRLVRFPAGGPVHLLIGETEKFEQAEAPDPTNAAEVAFYGGTNIDGNLAGTDSLWISINPRTGSITSAANGWQPWPTGSPTLPESLFRAREFARTSQTIGGG